MTGKTLIAYSTKTGINESAAQAIADTLRTSYNMDVTVVDLRKGQPDIMPYQNIIVGGGVDRKSVYTEAVDFLEKNFEGKNVAIYVSCEDNEDPQAQSTADNTKKLLAKNTSLKYLDITAFGGCMIRQGRPVMDDVNVERVRMWAIELGQKIIALDPVPPPAMVTPAVEKTPEQTTMVSGMPVIVVPPTAKIEGGFEIIRDSAGKFRFHLKATNGQIIAVSQAYGAKESAITGIDSIKKNAPIAKIVDLSTAEGAAQKSTHAAGIAQDPVFEIQFNAPDRYRFHLKAANGEIITVSQSYLSKQAAETGIASVKTNAPTAKVYDKTVEPIAAK